MIIGICGAKGAGKDTACKVLQRQIPMFQTARRVAFADKLKDVCAKCLGLSEMLFYDETFKEQRFILPIQITENHFIDIFAEFGIVISKSKPYATEDIKALMVLNRGVKLCKSLHTPREILQVVGTNVLREYDHLIHIRAALKDYKQNEVVIVTDMRFMNEFLYLMSCANSFMGLYINNPVLEIQKMSLTDPHSSELGYKEFSSLCVEIENDSSLEEFRWKVRSVGSNTCVPYFTARRSMR